MFDRTDSYRPWHRWLGLRIGRRGPDDDQVSSSSSPCASVADSLSLMTALCCRNYHPYYHLCYSYSSSVSGGTRLPLRALNPQSPLPTSRQHLVYTPPSFLLDHYLSSHPLTSFRLHHRPLRQLTKRIQSTLQSTESRKRGMANVHSAQSHGRTRLSYLLDGLSAGDAAGRQLRVTTRTPRWRRRKMKLREEMVIKWGQYRGERVDVQSLESRCFRDS